MRSRVTPNSLSARRARTGQHPRDCSSLLRRGRSTGASGWCELLRPLGLACTLRYVPPRCLAPRIASRAGRLSNHVRGAVAVPYETHSADWRRRGLCACQQGPLLRAGYQHSARLPGGRFRYFPGWLSSFVPCGGARVRMAIRVHEASRSMGIRTPAHAQPDASCSILAVRDDGERRQQRRCRWLAVALHLRRPSACPGLYHVRVMCAPSDRGQ